MVCVTGLLWSRGVSITFVGRMHCFCRYFFDVFNNTISLQINWPLFLPELACHSSHQVKTLGLTQYHLLVNPVPIEQLM